MGALYTPGTVVSSRLAVRCPAGTCRFPAASPCTPLERSAWRGPNVTRHHRGFTHVHPSGLPLACDPRTDRKSLGVFPELRTPPLPAAHVRAGTGHGHSPGITRPASAEPPFGESTQLVRPRVAPTRRCRAAARSRAAPRRRRGRGRRTRSWDESRTSSSTSARPGPCPTRTGSRQGVQGGACSARVGWRPMPGVRSRRSLSTLPAR